MPRVLSRLQLPGLRCSSCDLEARSFVAATIDQDRVEWIEPAEGISGVLVSGNPETVGQSLDCER